MYGRKVEVYICIYIIHFIMQEFFILIQQQKIMQILISNNLNAQWLGNDERYSSFCLFKYFGIVYIDHPQPKLTMSISDKCNRNFNFRFTLKIGTRLNRCFLIH